MTQSAIRVRNQAKDLFPGKVPMIKKLRTEPFDCLQM